MYTPVAADVVPSPAAKKIGVVTNDDDDDDDTGDVDAVNCVCGNNTSPPTVNNDWFCGELEKWWLALVGTNCPVSM